MNNEVITNLLLTLVAIAWFAKVFFHFNYLRIDNEDLQNSNPISFFTKFENFFNIMIIIMPIFLGGKQEADFREVAAKRKIWISICLLWLMLALTFVHLYNSPPIKH